MGNVAPRDRGTVTFVKQRKSANYRIPTVVVIIEVGQAMRRGSADDCESKIGGQAIEISPADMFTARVGIDGLACERLNL